MGRWPITIGTGVRLHRNNHLATFLDCVICGGTETTGPHRSTVKRILNENPKLQQRIEDSKRMDNSDNLFWYPEVVRIKNVVLKLARGHFAYELNPIYHNPVVVSFVSLHILNENERIAFEKPDGREQYMLPEIGSRAFLRTLGISPDQLEVVEGWNIVQPNRYRYMVTETRGVSVRMVLSEYLACEVLWE